MNHRTIGLCALLGLSLLSLAEESESELLVPDQALRPFPRVIGINIAEAVWDIEPDYNLRLEKIKLKSFDDRIAGSELTTPRGDTKTDNFFGTAKIFDHLEGKRVPVAHGDLAAAKLPARVSAGRCISATDVCDPPTVNELFFRLPPLQALRQSYDLAFLLANHSKSFLDLAPSASAPEAIDPELAFRVSLMGVRNDALHARFDIHECCYLYREKFRFTLTGHDGKPASKLRFGRYKLPPGEIKVDEFAGRTEVYHSAVDVILPIIADTASSTFGVQIIYQGCSEKGVIICYPPRTKNFKVVRKTGQFTVSESDNPK